MIRKSVKRFSEKIMLKQQPKRDDDSSQSHRALVVRFIGFAAAHGNRIASSVVLFSR